MHEIELIGRGHVPKWLPIGSATVRHALSLRYMQPEWACFFEVADGTGMAKSRSADCVAMNMYGSRGLAIHGIEIKVSRSDLKRELDNAAKADAVAQYCDRWWIAAPRGMVNPDELPEAWGLIEVWEVEGSSPQSQIKKQAAKLDAVAPSRAFVASMLRSSAKVSEDIIAKRVAVARDNAMGELEQIVERRTRNIRSHGAEAIQTLAKLKEFGIDPDSWKWNPEKIARVLKLADTGALDSWGGIESTVENLEKAIELMNKMKEALK